jgi:peptidylprolyl isomerase
LAGGDVDGVGGSAAEVGPDGQRFFADESFAIPHSEAGVLSMVSHGKDRNGSQFMVSLEGCPHHDGRHVGFGQLVEGEDVLRSLEGLLAVNGRPLSTITIVDCGVVGE